MSARRRPLSLGIHLPIAERTTAHPAPPWNEILALARSAESVGFDAIWIMDHLLAVIDRPEFPPEPIGCWECGSMLAALAATTERIAIAPFVSCMGFRNPALFAKIAETVDEISGGRLILGLGAGWCEREFDAFGFPFDHRVSRFEEAIAIIHGLLRDGRVDLRGTFHQATDCDLLPRGPRPGAIPILIGSTGERMLRLVARYADAWASEWTSGAAEIVPMREKVDAACRAIGRDPATLARYAAVVVQMPGREPARGSWVPAFRGLVGALSGSVEEIVAGIRAYAEVGIDHLILWPDPCTPESVEAFQPMLSALDRG